MAGYMSDYSRSRNAADAEDRGLLPASRLAKQLGGGITAAGIRVVLTAAELHHTSKMYNATDYYDWDDAVQEAALAALDYDVDEADDGTLERADVWLRAKVRAVSRAIRAQRCIWCGFPLETTSYHFCDGRCEHAWFMANR